MSFTRTYSTAKSARSTALGPAAPAGARKQLARAGGALAVAALLYGAYALWSAPGDQPASPAGAVDLKPVDASAAALPTDAAPPTVDLPSGWANGSRYRLQGVVEGVAADAEGVALIAVDGGEPRAYRVGTLVDGNLALLGVSAGGAILGPPNGPPLIVLDAANNGTAPGTASDQARISPSSPTDHEALLLPAAEPVPESRPTAQAPYTKPAPGRRVRLRPLTGPS